jgi:phosphoglycolate phosphatase
MDLLFDLDGTLTDPAAGIVRCIQHALAELGVPIPPDASLLRFIGPPLTASFRELLGTSDEARVQRAIALYRERYAPIGLLENTVYPDVPAGLAALTSAGDRLWVATSKPHVYARRILEHFGLAGFFTAVHGSELSGANADKSDLIRHVLTTESLDPAQTWMIGDRLHDVVGAHHNRLVAVGVLWGYGTRDELTTAGANHLVESMSELAHLIAASRR